MKSEAGAIRLDGVGETLVASTELLSFEPTAAQMAAVSALLDRFQDTTALLVTLAQVVRGLEGDRCPVGDACWEAARAVAAVEAVSL